MKRLTCPLIFAFLLAACQPAAAAQACDDAQFIDHVILDVPVEQGTTLMPGTHFTKAWQVKNEGSCDWTLNYSLVQINGPDLGEAQVVPLHDPVAAGQTADMAVRLTAPAEPGSYTAEWMLQSASGEQFGVGPEGDRPLSMQIVVPELPEGVVYAFTDVICLARWDSDRATYLPCEGEDDDQGILDGYVRVNSNLALANQPAATPVIEVKPNNGQDGWISGFFPPVTIQAGDHFTATIGCLAENPGCQVVFRLEAQFIDGSQRTLDEWPKQSDEIPSVVDVDLSELAGQEVTLVLTVLENGGRRPEAKAFWLDARVER